MAEGHIEFTLSVCVYVCYRIMSCVVGFENNLEQVIIVTRRCVANKNHVARSKVKVTVRT